MQNSSDTPAGLQKVAEQARRHAQALWPHPASEQLLAYANELEAKATAMEQAGEGDPATEPVG
jgi:hypothetical protein